LFQLRERDVRLTNISAEDITKAVSELSLAAAATAAAQNKVRLSLSSLEYITQRSRLLLGDVTINQELLGLTPGQVQSLSTGCNCLQTGKSFRYIHVTNTKVNFGVGKLSTHLSGLGQGRAHLSASGGR